MEIRNVVGDAELETFQIELRQQANELLGVLVQEGRAATGGRRELFIPGAVEWLASGVDILPEHRAGAETKVIPTRESDGRITFTTPLDASTTGRVGCWTALYECGVSRYGTTHRWRHSRDFNGRW